MNLSPAGAAAVSRVWRNCDQSEASALPAGQGRIKVINEYIARLNLNVLNKKGKIESKKGQGLLRAERGLKCVKARKEGDIGQ